MKVWPFAAALAEGGCKPPHAALAEDRRGERCGKGARDASGGDREDGAQSSFSGIAVDVSLLVNMLSIVSFYAVPFNASYCASKAAQWALTNALRIELNGQGTLVVGVHAGFIDTDMANGVDQPKVAPCDVARQALDAVEAGIPEVLADAETRWVKRAVPDDQTLLYPDLQRSWDAGLSPSSNTGSR
jgi:NAD(P)-dependent dehydrogenase (short-subunit alcohol dehydrogenase family)